jgi:hypothetical protein
MKFTPKTNEEIESMGLIDPGMYKFSVLEAEDQISKTGNEMIKLTLRVQDAHGIMHNIFDYLLEKGKPMAFKLRHFCEHTGLLAKYEAGELTAADCLDKTGVCEVIVQPGQDKYDGSKYPDKNAIKDYLQNKSSISKDPLPETTGHPAFDDDIPF